MQNSRWLFEVVRGIPTMIIPGFALRHARTVASCASSLVKSHVSSNKATRRKGRVVRTLLTPSFSCCILDWVCRFGHISSMFLSLARRTRRGTDFVGLDSSTIQWKNHAGMLKDSVTCSPDSTFCFGTSPRFVIWLSGVARFRKSTGDRYPGPPLSAAPALLEARCLVVADGNHVRVYTLEALPVYKSNIAPVQAES